MTIEEEIQSINHFNLPYKLKSIFSKLPTFDGISAISMDEDGILSITKNGETYTYEGTIVS